MASAFWAQFHNRGAPPAHSIRRQAKPCHFRDPTQNGMHPFPQLPRALAVDDPDLQDAALPALGQVFRYQIIDFPGLEQVQVERAGYGPGSGARGRGQRA
jgi:hypothetical protein